MRPDTAYIADALRQYADALTAGELDGARRYLPADLNDVADTIEGDVNDLLNVIKSLLNTSRRSKHWFDVAATARALLAKAEPASSPEAPCASEAPAVGVPAPAAHGGLSTSKES